MIARSILETEQREASGELRVLSADEWRERRAQRNAGR